MLRPGGLLVATVWQRDEAVPFFGALEDLAAAIDPGGAAARAQQQAEQEGQEEQQAGQEGQQGQQQQAEGRQAAPSGPCRFGDPAPLLHAAEAAGFEGVGCRELRLAFSLAADEWWECLCGLPDTPVKVGRSLRLPRHPARAHCAVLSRLRCAWIPHASALTAPLACLPTQAALERARAAGVDLAASRRAAEQLLRQHGWVQPDGSVLAPDQLAWLITARAGN